MRTRNSSLIAALIAIVLAPAADAQEPPPIPESLAAWTPSSNVIDGTVLQEWTAVFAMGGAGKAGPLASGEKVQAAATSANRLQRQTIDGRTVWARSVEVYPAGAETAMMTGVIYLDENTLAPISSRVEQQGQVIATEYDWEAGTVRQTVAGGEPQAESADQTMMEAAAHDVWMGAVDWSAAPEIRIPAILAGGGGQYWMVPRVVGTEEFDIGDGTVLSAWVIELDWWDRASGDHYPGGGVNGTAGAGGMYWVLQNPPAGVPPVVRIRTEVNETTDQVVQMQDGPTTEGP